MQVGPEHLVAFAVQPGHQFLHLGIFRHLAHHLPCVIKSLGGAARIGQAAGIKEQGEGVVAVHGYGPLKQGRALEPVALGVVKAPGLAHDQFVLGGAGHGLIKRGGGVVDAVLPRSQNALAHKGNAFVGSLYLLGENLGGRQGVAVAGPHQGLNAQKTLVVVLFALLKGTGARHAHAHVPHPLRQAGVGGQIGGNVAAHKPLLAA